MTPRLWPEQLEGWSCHHPSCGRGGGDHWGGRWGKYRRQGWPTGNEAGQLAPGPALGRRSLEDAPLPLQECPPEAGHPQCFQAREEAVAVRPLPTAPHHPQAALNAKVLLLVIACEVRQEAISKLCSRPAAK